MLQLEKLHLMPNMTRVEANEDAGTEGGYEYPERYQGKLFQIEDKIILFEKRRHQEFPVSMINILSTIFVDENKLSIIKEDLDLTQNQKFDDLAANLEEFQNELNNKIDSILEPLKEEIKQLGTNNEIISLGDKINKVYETVDLINQDVKNHVQTIVNTELKVVHDNFKLVVGQLVKDEVNKIKDIINNSENKLKPGQIAMFREMGLPISEIIELKQNGMI